MIDYSKIYKVRKQKKQKNYNREKKRKLYNRFIKTALVFIILLAIISLLSGIGKVIIYLSSASFLLSLGLGLTIIGDITFNNLGIIFFLVVVIAMTNNIKAIVVGIFAIIFFFGFQQFFIQYFYNNKGELQFKSLLFFYKNLDYFVWTPVLRLAYIKLTLAGGILLGILSSYIFNKYHEYRLPKTIGFLNGTSFVILILIPAIILFDFFYMLLFIGFNEIILGFSISDLSSKNTGSVILLGLFSILLKPFGFEQMLIQNGGTYSYESFLKFFGLAARSHGWILSPFTNNWVNSDNVISTELNEVWEYLQQLSFGSQKFGLLTWLNLISIGNLPTATGILIPFTEWFITSWISNFLVVAYNQTNALIFVLALSMTIVTILTAKKQKRASTAGIIGLIVGSTILTGNLVPLELLFMFITPLLYCTMYLPINLINWLIMFSIGVYIPFDYSQGLLLFLITGFQHHQLFNNLYLIVVLNLCWIGATTPIFYRYVKWNNVSLAGYQEEILPRITKRQYHEIFNH